MLFSVYKRSKSKNQCLRLPRGSISQIWLTNLAERYITTRNIGITYGLRVVYGHILHADFIYAIGLGCMSSCEELFAF